MKLMKICLKLAQLMKLKTRSDIANNALNEQFMHTEQNTLLPDQKKQPGHSTVQSTSKPIEIEESSLDKGKEMEVEEKPSFYHIYKGVNTLENDKLSILEICYKEIIITVKRNGLIK